MLGRDTSDFGPYRQSEDPRSNYSPSDAGGAPRFEVGGGAKRHVSPSSQDHPRSERPIRNHSTMDRNNTESTIIGSTDKLDSPGGRRSYEDGSGGRRGYSNGGRSSAPMMDLPQVPEPILNYKHLLETQQFFAENTPELPEFDDSMSEEEKYQAYWLYAGHCLQLINDCRLLDFATDDMLQDIRVCMVRMREWLMNNQHHSMNEDDKDEEKDDEDTTDDDSDNNNQAPGYQCYHHSYHQPLMKEKKNVSIQSSMIGFNSNNEKEEESAESMDDSASIVKRSHRDEIHGPPLIQPTDSSSNTTTDTTTNTSMITDQLRYISMKKSSDSSDSSDRMSDMDEIRGLQSSPISSLYPTPSHPSLSMINNDEDEEEDNSDDFKASELVSHPPSIGHYSSNHLISGSDSRSVTSSSLFEPPIDQHSNNGHNNSSSNGGASGGSGHSYDSSVGDRCLAYLNSVEPTNNLILFLEMQNGFLQSSSKRDDDETSFWKDWDYSAFWLFIRRNLVSKECEFPENDYVGQHSLFIAQKKWAEISDYMDQGASLEWETEDDDRSWAVSILNLLGLDEQSVGVERYKKLLDQLVWIVHTEEAIKTSERSSFEHRMKEVKEGQHTE